MFDFTGRICDLKWVENCLNRRETIDGSKIFVWRFVQCELIDGKRLVLFIVWHVSSLKRDLINNSLSDNNIEILFIGQKWRKRPSMVCSWWKALLQSSSVALWELSQVYPKSGPMSFVRFDVDELCNEFHGNNHSMDLETIASGRCSTWHCWMSSLFYCRIVYWHLWSLLFSDRTNFDKRISRHWTFDKVCSKDFPWWQCKTFSLIRRSKNDFN